MDVVEISADCNYCRQDSVDLLSLSRFLILVQNQHSKLLKFHADDNITESPLSTEHYLTELKMSSRASNGLSQSGGC